MKLRLLRFVKKTKVNLFYRDGDQGLGLNGVYTYRYPLAGGRRNFNRHMLCLVFIHGGALEFSEMRDKIHKKFPKLLLSASSIC